MNLVYPQIVTGADLLRGIVKLDELAPLLQQRGASAAAIVNSKLYGVRSFSKMLLKYGVRPVIGLAVYVTVDEQDVLVYAYAQNQAGYANLLKMSSAAAVRKEENLPLAWVRAYQEGCAFVLAATDASWAEKRTEEVFAQFSLERAAVGIARPAGAVHPEEAAIAALAETLSLPVAACHETRYIHAEDVKAFEIASAVRGGYKVSDENKPRNRHKHAFLPDAAQWQAWFSDRSEWLDVMQQLMDGCRAVLPEEPFHLPEYYAAGEDAARLLEAKCREGLMQRFGVIEADYEQRLQHELAIIEQMGFTHYFLIVEDYVRYAKNEGILVGPGRGSSAGSLVAFALSITEVDPLRYGLLFERFLNPERVTLPDIDIDFADSRRMEVVNYVAETYGRQHAAQIIAFGTLSAKAVARNIARVLDFTPQETRFMAGELDSRLSFKENISKSKRLRDWIAADPKRALWQQAAERLEDLPRNASTHAAGVVLSAEPLVHYVPLQTGTEEVFLTQWAMQDVEQSGLLKMDFLGLRNLTLLGRIRSMIEHDRRQQIDFERIPLDDAAVYDLFCAGDTAGIFQFESPGMRQALRTVQPREFRDLYTVNALYRPGPMEFIPMYGRRKNGGEQTEYAISELEPILRDTYGIIVFQEQIMKIAVEIAGFTLAQADLLRRAVSKKNEQILQSERRRFVEGAEQNGVSREKADQVYSLIAKFADYGFPKSHAVAYTIISYRLAYFKANDPAYFYAAFLSSLAGSQEKMMELLREIRAKGIEVRPPSVKHSRYSHTVEGNAIRLGIRSVKGVTFAFYEQLAKARADRQWTTMFDMAQSLGAQQFTEKMLEPLIKAGALDEFNETRAVLLASIEAAHAHALFTGGQLQFDSKPKYTPAGDLDLLAQLAFERETLGFYLSEHPVEQLKRTAHKAPVPLAEADGTAQGARIDCIGMISSIRKIRTKKGDSMAFVTLQDETAELSCTLFPKQFAQYEPLLSENAFVEASGTIEYRNETVQLIVQQLTAKYLQ